MYIRTGRHLVHTNAATRVRQLEYEFLCTVRTDLHGTAGGEINKNFLPRQRLWGKRPFWKRFWGNPKTVRFDDNRLPFYTFPICGLKIREFHIENCVTAVEKSTQQSSTNVWSLSSWKQIERNLSKPRGSLRNTRILNFYIYIFIWNCRKFLYAHTHTHTHSISRKSVLLWFEKKINGFAKDSKVHRIWKFTSEATQEHRIFRSWIELYCCDLEIKRNVFAKNSKFYRIWKFTSEATQEHRLF